MRFLDLDLDFFLDCTAYYSGNGRLTSNYKPWSTSKVRQFLEKRCGLSRNSPLPGRILQTHSGVFDFWHTLIQSGNLRLPFDLIHIDAHPDIWVGDGLHLVSTFLHINAEVLRTSLSKKSILPGNYLTFAIAYGWISSLLWVSLQGQPDYLYELNGKMESNLMQLRKRRAESAGRESDSAKDDLCIPFRILFWQKFRTREKFDYVAFSRSPDFTPLESDALIPIVEEYMKQI